MFERIVVGVDGSDHAQRALAAAAELATQAGGTVYVVEAVHYPSAGEVARELAELPDEFKNAYDAMAGERVTLDWAEKFLGDRGVEHSTSMIESAPADAILDEADRVDADLIVVGSRGLGRGTRLLRGSVSTKVAGHTDRSVLVLH